MKQIVRSCLMGLLLLHVVPGALFTIGQETASAGSDWKQEFAAVCGKTQNAMELTPDELRGYIDRCNKLESRLPELNGGGSEKKIYAKRLKMCKELYVYTLESRDTKDERP